MGSGQNVDAHSLTNNAEDCWLEFDFKVYKYKIEDRFARKCYQSIIANSKTDKPQKSTREIGIQAESETDREDLTQKLQIQ